MSLFITSLNSGSNGNCYYIGNEQEAILVDAGICCRETGKRMARLGLSMDKVKAIFVSHEHADHITGIPVLAKKYQLPVYITECTHKQSGLSVDSRLLIYFRSYEPVQVGSLVVNAFPKFHDACDPHSFVVSSKTVKVGVFTDIGFSCEQVIRHFSQCHAAFLECNYDVGMLTNGSYPYHLKKRIMGGRGHLSNVQALQLVKDHRPSFMSHLLLSHLSKNNNCPKLVHDLFSNHAGSLKVIVASRYAETPLFFISGDTSADNRPKSTQELYPHVQLSLF